MYLTAYLALGGLFMLGVFWRAQNPDDKNFDGYAAFRSYRLPAQVAFISFVVLTWPFGLLVELVSDVANAIAGATSHLRRRR